MVKTVAWEIGFHVSKALRSHWTKNSLVKMKEQNSDRVYIVDGMERSGKSTWTIQQMWFLDREAFETPEKFVSRIVFTPDEFSEAIKKIHNGVIIFDEAFRGLSSRGTMSKVNKKLIQGLMEMGQNNNVVFIVLPRIWLLDIYPAMLRSHGLFNISIDKKTGKRMWRGWNASAKNIIYQVGAKKGWKYVIPTPMRGWFFGKFPGGPEFEKAYLKKKADAFKKMEKVEEKLSPRAQFNETLSNYMLAEVYARFKSTEKASNYLKERGIQVSHDKISMAWQDYGYMFDKEAQEAFNRRSYTAKLQAMPKKASKLVSEASLPYA